MTHCYSFRFHFLLGRTWTSLAIFASKYDIRTDIELTSFEASFLETALSLGTMMVPGVSEDPVTCYVHETIPSLSFDRNNAEEIMLAKLYSLDGTCRILEYPSRKYKREICFGKDVSMYSDLPGKKKLLGSFNGRTMIDELIIEIHSTNDLRGEVRISCNNFEELGILTGSNTNNPFLVDYRSPILCNRFSLKMNSSTGASFHDLLSLAFSNGFECIGFSETTHSYQYCYPHILVYRTINPRGLFVHGSTNALGVYSLDLSDQLVTPSKVEEWVDFLIGDSINNSSDTRTLTANDTEFKLTNELEISKGKRKGKGGTNYDQFSSFVLDLGDGDVKTVFNIQELDPALRETVELVLDKLDLNDEDVHKLVVISDNDINETKKSDEVVNESDKNLINDDKLKEFWDNAWIDGALYDDDGELLHDVSYTQRNLNFLYTEGHPCTDASQLRKVHVVMRCPEEVLYYIERQKQKMNNNTNWIPTDKPIIRAVRLYNTCSHRIIIDVPHLCADPDMVPLSTRIREEKIFCTKSNRNKEELEGTLLSEISEILGWRK